MWKERFDVSTYTARHHLLYMSIATLAPRSRHLVEDEPWRGNCVILPAFRRGINMWTRATRWAVAALIGSAMTTIGCARVEKREPPTAREPIVADDIVHAFDTNMELRLIDRLELDTFLRDRQIRVQVVDGIVNITGHVWTPLEKERAADLLRRVPGVIDVANDLTIRPPY